MKESAYWDKKPLIVRNSLDDQINDFENCIEKSQNITIADLDIDKTRQELKNLSDELINVENKFYSEEEAYRVMFDYLKQQEVMRKLKSIV